MTKKNKNLNFSDISIIYKTEKPNKKPWYNFWS